VSDGDDNSGRHKYSEVLALARQSQAIICAIGLVGASGGEENPRVPERLCKDTGELAFFPRTLGTVTELSNPSPVIYVSKSSNTQTDFDGQQGMAVSGSR
jgi:hypothetical protein